MAVKDQFLVTMTISAKITINQFLKSELQNEFFRIIHSQVHYRSTVLKNANKVT